MADTGYEARATFYRRILVPLDGSEMAEFVLGAVGEIVRGCTVSEVIFVRVMEHSRILPQDDYSMTEDQARSISRMAKDGARKYLNDVVSRVRYAVKTEILEGSPAEAILDYANKTGVDLIIMSTHGRSGVSRWFAGSVADKVLRGARAPVLLVRAPGCAPKRIDYPEPPPLEYPTYDAS